MENNNDSIITHTEQQLKSVLIKKENRFDQLNKVKIFAYGVGHFINDLVAACWFNYLFLFLKRVVQTQAAASALLAGQLADGIATPIVGYLSDKFNTRFGQRMPWYLFGLILVCTCYVPIYHKYRNEQIAFDLFNVGWASLQISHMSLVPSLTCSRKRRDRLNNLRNSFTFISNFLVLGMGVIIFSLMTDAVLQFAIISYIVVVIGLSASIFFMYQIRQVPLSKACHQKAQALKQEIAERKNPNCNKKDTSSQFSEDQENGIVPIRPLFKAQSVFDWFKMPKFYLFGICYMGVRLYTNMFGTLLPFYLLGVLKLGVEEDDSNVPFTIALVPLIVYFTSVLSSSRLNWFYLRFGRKKALLLGTIICTICLGSMLFLTRQVGWIMYIIAIFIGCSQSLVLSTGINLISDVVGTRAKTGAFVFGVYSLLDKFSAGLVMFIIGNTQSYTIQPSNLNNDQIIFIKYTTIFIPSLSCILATAIVLSYPIQEYTKKKKYQDIRKNSLEEEFVT